MPALEFVLVRHGQSEGNRDRVFTGHGPARLTSLGVAQAEAVAERLTRGETPLRAIYVSDLARALETAAPLARRLNLTPIVTPDLRERGVGELTGLTFAEAEVRYPEVWRALFQRDVDYCPPGGESLRMCSARLDRFVDGVIESASGEGDAGGRVVVVSHGVAIDRLLRRFLGIVDGPRLACLFHVDNCSIHRVERRDDGLTRVVCLNDIGHLAGLESTADARTATPRE